MLRPLLTFGLVGALAIGQSAYAAPGGGHGGGGGGHGGGGGGHGSVGGHVGGYSGGHVGGYSGGYSHPGNYGGTFNHVSPAYNHVSPAYNHGSSLYNGHNGYYGNNGGNFYSPLNSGRYGGYGYGGYGYNRGYGYGGLGFGLGFGLPFGSGYYNYYYANPGYAPYSSRYYGSGIYFSPYATMATTPLDIPQSSYPMGLADNVPPTNPGSESGLKITDLYDGSAKKADLRAGDVILGVGKTRTRTFEELQAALAESKGDVDLIFLNSENGKVEKLPLKPLDGKIGVGVIPVNLN